jgi:hypothetical protein
LDPATEARITWRTLAGLLALALAVAAVAAPVCVWAEPPLRPVAVRVAVAVFCACALWRLTRAVAGAVGLDVASAADLALDRAAPPARPDPLLPMLASEVRRGLARRRRFDRALWSRLQALAGRRGVVLPPDVLPGPLGRRMREADVERAMSMIERAGRTG